MGGIDCGRIKERKSKLRFQKEGKQVTHGHVEGSVASGRVVSFGDGTY